mgnify:CR=1 FL=1
MDTCHESGILFPVIIKPTSAASVLQTGANCLGFAVQQIQKLAVVSSLNSNQALFSAKAITLYLTIGNETVIYEIGKTRAASCFPTSTTLKRKLDSNPAGGAPVGLSFYSPTPTGLPCFLR